MNPFKLVLLYGTIGMTLGLLMGTAINISCITSDVRKIRIHLVGK